MAFEGSEKAETIANSRLSEKDTGSPEVQIAILTKRLEIVSGHLKKFPQDKSSQHGLLLMVSRRKRLINYLKRASVSRYHEALTKFGLRK